MISSPRASALLVAAFLASAWLPACYRLRPIDSLANPGEHAVEHEAAECRLCALFAGVRGQMVRIPTDAGSGTGVVVSGDGAVLTNALALPAADRFRVEAGNGQRYEVRVAHRSADHDLALLRVEGPAPAPLPFGPEELPGVGTDVFLIRHAPGLGWTVTPGRVLRHSEGGEGGAGPMIQTDIAIPGGCPGGPLLDGEGRLVGLLTTETVAPDAAIAAFAIPARALQAYLNERTRPTGSTPTPGTP
jgi:S1-C subfamily serine protease